MNARVTVLLASWTADEVYRVLFALQAYHGVLSDDLNARHKATRNDPTPAPGLAILRAGMLDTERQLAELERAIGGQS